jgi:hypothetical protein
MFYAVIKGKSLTLNIDTILVFETVIVNVLLFIKMKWKKKIYHTIGTVPKFYRKIVETDAKSIPLTHKYMSGQFPVLIQALQ